MSSTNFTQGTVIASTWLNDVNDTVYDVLGDGTNVPTTTDQVRINIGLGNVDNTSDLDKPVSTATSNYIDQGTTLKTSNIGSSVVPTGTTADRDPTPDPGYFRFNSDTGRFEGYDGTTWGSVGGGATGGGSNVFIENGQVVSENYTVPSGKNAGSFGPITINSGAVVTVPVGSVWSIV